MEISTWRVISARAAELRTFLKSGKSAKKTLQLPHLQSVAAKKYLGNDADQRTACRKVQCCHFLVELFLQELDVVFVSLGF